MLKGASETPLEEVEYLADVFLPARSFEASAGGTSATALSSSPCGTGHEYNDDKTGEEQYLNPPQRRTVPMPFNRSKAEIGAVQVAFHEKKIKTWTDPSSP